MIVAVILGLVVPGYALARALQSPLALATAFPLSALMLAETVIAYACLGVTISVATVGTVLAIASVTALIIWAIRGLITAAPPQSSPGPTAPRWLQAIVAVHVVLVLAAIIVKAYLAPLTGPDTPYRWDALARLMLDDESLRHYPPVSSDDFTKYSYPDGLPPLVSTVYWWLYAGCGAPFAPVTSLAIVLQAASCFALVFYAGRAWHGTMGGLLALVAISSSYRYFYGVVIGQDTGYTALSVAGQLAFTFAAVRNPGWGLVTIAGMFGGLGALSRDYGPLLSLCGAAVLVSWPETRRLTLLFCGVAAACAAPWYVRNWLITGNPLYAMDVLHLGLPANAIHEGLHAGYREVVGFQTFTAGKSALVAKDVFLGAPLALVAGIPGIVRAGRNGMALAISVIVVCFLWIWSIPYTHGGVTLSLRVLTPAIVTLSIAAAACAPAIARLLAGRPSFVQVSVCAALLACCGGGVLASWTYPRPISEIRTSVLYTWNYPEDSLGPSLPTMRMLEATDLPPVGVLADNPYTAVAMQRFTRFHPVLIWSPEVAFVFEKQLDPAEIRRRLREKRIWFVSVARENYNYLNQFPFFERDSINWKYVRDERHLYPILYLPP